MVVFFSSSVKTQSFGTSTWSLTRLFTISWFPGRNHSNQLRKKDLQVCTLKCRFILNKINDTFFCSSDAADMSKLLAQLESLLGSVDEPPNEISRSDCLVPKRDQRCYSKEDIQELRRAYHDKITLSYDRKTLMDLGQSQLSMKKPSFDTEKTKNVLK